MSRKKDIEKAAKEITQDIEDWEVAEDIEDAFIEGALWADRTMIERACRYFENIACCGWIEDIEVEEFISKFKKAMINEQRETN